VYTQWLWCPTPLVPNQSHDGFAQAMWRHALRLQRRRRAVSTNRKNCRTWAIKAFRSNKRASTWTLAIKSPPSNRPPNHRRLMTGYCNATLRRRRRWKSQPPPPGKHNWSGNPTDKSSPVAGPRPNAGTDSRKQDDGIPQKP
jgi:hypothetical protein